MILVLSPVVNRSAPNPHAEHLIFSVGIHALADSSRRAGAAATYHEERGSRGPRRSRGPRKFLGVPCFYPGFVTPRLRRIVNAPMLLSMFRLV